MEECLRPEEFPILMEECLRPEEFPIPMEECLPPEGLLLQLQQAMQPRQGRRTTEGLGLGQQDLRGPKYGTHFNLYHRLLTLLFSIRMQSIQ